MPLYLDIHTVDSDSFSVEDVVKAHMEDLAIQEQFGVTQLKYWVNVEARTLFCLMKGPTIEACNEVLIFRSYRASDFGDTVPLSKEILKGKKVC